ncbi:MAG: hypothetical protein IAG13_17060, partial [Deltaproteobacteria bacterium]|nr:hypothetical protein [Nannocystaceae bacterium]
EELIEHADTLRGDARRAALGADISFIAGGVVALAGVVLVAVGHSKPRRGTVALTPSIGAAHAGMIMTGRF